MYIRVLNFPNPREHMFKMSYIRVCTIYIMKSLFLCALFLSMLFVVFLLINNVHPEYNEIHTSHLPPRSESAIDKLLWNLTQDDGELVGKLRSEVLPPPLGKYSFSRGDKPFKEHVLERAVRQFRILGRGFFVEVGAGDGENRSPTVCLEIDDKWTGLLIEADMRFWRELKSKRRKVFLGLSCVGLTNRSYVGMLGIKEMTRSKLVQKWDIGFADLAEVSCYPLYSYLLAVDKTDVDFLVININGQEIKILQSLPWDKVTIHMIAICYGTKREKVETNDFLATKGYRLHRKYHQDGEMFLMFTKLKKSP